VFIAEEVLLRPIWFLCGRLRSDMLSALVTLAGPIVKDDIHKFHISLCATSKTAQSEKSNRHFSVFGL